MDFTAEVERSLRISGRRRGGSSTPWRAFSPSPRPYGGRPTSTTFLEYASSTRWNRVGADFQRTIDSITQRLQGNPVAIQLPIGAEQDFEGIIDLIEERAYFYHTEGPEPPIEGPIPADMLDTVRDYRERLIEKVADTDDEILIKYLEGEEITVEDIRTALRHATVTNAIMPVLCGSALRHRGGPSAARRDRGLSPVARWMYHRQPAAATITAKR